jgi:hypothetical protein
MFWISITCPLVAKRRLRSKSSVRRQLYVAADACREGKDAKDILFLLELELSSGVL